MLHLCFSILLLVHGFIHIIGLVQAFGCLPKTVLSKPISHGTGLLWGLAAMLILAAMIFVLLHDSRWWIIAGCGLALSQALIVGQWRDARLGTIANVMILLAVISGAASW